VSLKDINWNLSYETTENEYELLEKFYVPALQQAVKYYRIAGYFTSSSLIMASKGIEGLIHNGGKMYLLVSPQMTEEDFEVISKHGKLSENSNIFIDLMNDFSMPDERLQALGWLLDIGRLEIKVVVRNKSQNSIFHEKIGVLFDKEGNIDPVFLHKSEYLAESGETGLRAHSRDRDMRGVVGESQRVFVIRAETHRRAERGDETVTGRGGIRDMLAGDAGTVDRTVPVREDRSLRAARDDDVADPAVKQDLRGARRVFGGHDGDPRHILGFVFVGRDIRRP